MQGPGMDPGQPDDWMWLLVVTPTQDYHLYELGYPRVVDELDDEGRPTGVQHHEALSATRMAQIMAELGGPHPSQLTADGAWRATISPGRPNHLLEPKQADADDNLLPLKAKPGVILHPYVARAD